MSAPVFVAGGVLTATGAEQPIFEAGGSVAGIWEVLIDLTNLAGGDTVVIKQYRSIPGHSLLLEKSTSLSGVQTLKLFSTSPVGGYGVTPDSFKVTLTQSAGSMRTYNYSAFQY